MYKEDIIKNISDLLGDKLVISCISFNISRGEHGLRMTEDSYSSNIEHLSKEELESIYIKLMLDRNKSWYYLNQYEINSRYI